MHRNRETLILGILYYPFGISETQELFPRPYFTHKTSYAYLSLLISCQNIRENLDSDLYWAGDGRLCGGFRQFASWRHGTRLASFFVVPVNCIFRGASCKSITELVALVPKKLKICMKLSYTIFTPYVLSGAVWPTACTCVFVCGYALTNMGTQIHMYLRSWIHVCACIHIYMWWRVKLAGLF